MGFNTSSRDFQWQNNSRKSSVSPADGLIIVDDVSRSSKIKFEMLKYSRTPLLASSSPILIAKFKYKFKCTCPRAREQGCNVGGCAHSACAGPHPLYLYPCIASREESNPNPRALKPLFLLNSAFIRIQRAWGCVHPQDNKCVTIDIFSTGGLPAQPN